MIRRRENPVNLKCGRDFRNIIDESCSPGVSLKQKSGRKGAYTMKKLVAIISVLVLFAALLPASALGEIWHCGYCGTQNDLYFCRFCGKAKTTTSTTDCYSLAIDRLSTRDGPSPRYNDMGTYNLKGQYVRIVAKSWDSYNGIWWVECDIPNVGRLWTGAKRFDASTLPLDVLPTENWDYYGSGMISSGSSTHSGSASGQGSSIIQFNNSPYGWLIGRWGMVCVNEGFARSGPGVAYSDVDIVYHGEWYQILDVQRGDTTKDWCKVTLNNGVSAWISTGLLEIDGYQGGTIYGNWAP